jgi:hypothetical protein
MPEGLFTEREKLVLFGPVPKDLTAYEIELRKSFAEMFSALLAQVENNDTEVN